MLLRTIDEARKYVRLSKVSESSILPPIAETEQLHLLPLIGQALYDKLEADYESLVITPYTTAYQKLLQQCQQFIAPMAYASNLATYQTLITDSGIRTQETTNMAAAHAWEFNKLREDLYNRAAIAMELLLQFLYKNSGSLPEWTASAEYTTYNKLLIRTAADFDKHFKLYDQYRTFHHLRPLMQDVEELYIVPTIGRDLLNWVKGRTDMLITVENQQVDMMLHLKKAITCLTVKLACLRLHTQYSVAGFTVLQNSNSDDANPGRADAGQARLEKLNALLEQDGQTWLEKLRYFMNGTYNGDFDNGFDAGFSTAFDLSPLKPTTATPAELDSQNDTRKIYVMGM